MTPEAKSQIAVFYGKWITEIHEKKRLEFIGDMTILMSACVKSGIEEFSKKLRETIRKRPKD